MKDKKKAVVKTARNAQLRYKQSLLENPSLGIQNEEWLQESIQLTSIILDA